MSRGSNHGSQYASADAVIGVSGKPIRVFNVTWLSGAGGAGSLVLKNGTSASGSAYITKTGTGASVSDTLNFESGLLFPDGCFFDKGANVASIAIEFSVEQTEG